MKLSYKTSVVKLVICYSDTIHSKKNLCPSVFHFNSSTKELKLTKMLLKIFIFSLIFITNLTFCKNYKKIQIFNHTNIDECENVSIVLMKIIDKIFISQKIPFDIIVIGNSTKISSVSNAIGKLNRGKFASKVRSPHNKFLPLKANETSPRGLKQSAVILVNGTRRFDKALMLPNLRHHKPYKVLIYCYGQSVKGKKILKFINF